MTTMQTKLLQLENRISELEAMAERIEELAKQLIEGRGGQPELSIKGQSWFRGARELLRQNGSSCIGEFEACYISYVEKPAMGRMRTFCDIEQYLNHGTSPRNPVPGLDHYHRFVELFRKARSLAQAAVEEIKSRELPVASQLSFAVATSELDVAGEVLAVSSGNDALLRASGVVARVALERHLLTVADTHSVAVTSSSPTKKLTAQDVLNALGKQSVITPIQKSELESLFKIGNFCAHPKESVTHDDVVRLVSRGRELCAVIL
jgi:hypothetical protein